MIKFDSLFLKVSKTVDRFPLITALTILLISLFLIYSKIIFGNYHYAFLDIGADTSGSYWPYLKYLANQFSNLDFSMYSFNLGIGTSLYSTSQLIFDPFNIPFFLLGGNSVLPGLIWICILKLSIILILSFYLLNILNLSKPVSIIGAYLIALNGYAMLWGQHYFFLTGVVYFLALVLSFEIFLQKGRWIWFVIVIALFASFSFYFFFIAGLFLFLYAFARIFGSTVSSGWAFKSKLNFLIIGFLVTVIGIALSAVVSFPTISYLLESPRIVSNISNAFHLISIQQALSYFYRLFSNDVLGVGSSFYGFDNYYSSPIMYAGVLALVSLPITFYYLNKKAKYIFIGLLVFIILGIAFDTISAITNGFVLPYTRWTFVLVVSNVILSMWGIDQFIKDPRPILRICLIYIFLLGIAFSTFPFAFRGALSWNYHKLFIFGFFIFGLMGLYLFAFRKFRKPEKSAIGYAMLAFLVFTELTATQIYSISKRQLMTKTYAVDHVYFHSSYGHAIEFLKAKDKSYYRIASDRLSLLTEPLLYGYLGLTEYCSLSDPNYVKFLDTFEPGVVVTSVIVKGPVKNYQLATVLGVKYFITKSTSVAWKGYSHFANVEGYNIFLNNNWLPLVLMQSSIPMQRSKVTGLIFSEKNLIENATDTDYLTQLQNSKSLIFRSDPQYFNSVESKASIDKLRSQLKNIYFMESGRIKIKFQSLSSSFATFTIPYSTGWEAVVNGKPATVKNVNFGLVGVPIGDSEGDIELTYIPRGLVMGKIISMIAVCLVILWQSILFFLNKNKKHI